MAKFESRGWMADTCMVNFSGNSIPFRVVAGAGELFRAKSNRFTSEGERRLFGLTCLLFEPVRWLA